MGNSSFFPTNLCARSDVHELGVVVRGDGDRADAAPHRGDPALEQDDGRAQGFDLTDVLHLHISFHLSVPYIWLAIDWIGY